MQYREGEHHDVFTRWLEYRRTQGELTVPGAWPPEASDYLRRGGMYWFSENRSIPGGIEVAVGWEPFDGVPDAGVFHFWVHPDFRKARSAWRVINWGLERALSEYEVVAVLVVDSPAKRVRAVERIGFEHLGTASTTDGRPMDVLAMSRDRFEETRSLRDRG